MHCDTGKENAKNRQGILSPLTCESERSVQYSRVSNPGLRLLIWRTFNQTSKWCLVHLARGSIAYKENIQKSNEIIHRRVKLTSFPQMFTNSLSTSANAASGTPTNPSTCTAVEACLYSFSSVATGERPCETTKFAVSHFSCTPSQLTKYCPVYVLGEGDPRLEPDQLARLRIIRRILICDNTNCPLQ